MSILGFPGWSDPWLSPLFSLVQMLILLGSRSCWLFVPIHLPFGDQGGALSISFVVHIVCKFLFLLFCSTYLCSFSWWNLERLKNYAIGIIPESSAVYSPYIIQNAIIKVVVQWKDDPPASSGDMGLVPGLERFCVPGATKPCHKGGHCSEKPGYCNEEQSPLTTARESPHKNNPMKTQGSKKKVHQATSLWSLIKMLSWNFLGGPVVKTPLSKAGSPGLIPGQGTKILHMVECGQKFKKCFPGSLCL